MLYIVLNLIIPLIVLAFIVLGFWAKIASENSNTKLFDEYQECSKKQLEDIGFVPDVEYLYEDILFGVMIKFSVDESKQAISVLNSNKVCDLINFSDIMGYEVMEDNQVVGGISRAIVGGIVAGGAGAIIGSQTAHKKKVYSYGIAIYLNNIKNPRMMIPIIKNSVKPTDKRYKEAIKFSDNVGITLKTIIARNQAATNQ